MLVCSEIVEEGKPMSYPVVTYFDPATEARLTALRASLPPPASDEAREALQVRPHVSLAGWEELDVDPFTAALQTFAARTAPLDVHLGAVGIFPGDQGVVFIAPRVTTGLLKLHAEFHAHLGAFGSGPNPYCTLDTWIPHSTVAMYLAEAELPAVVQACQGSDLFGPARLVEIALLEYPPVRQLCAFPLRPPDTS
jgi:2'-5' RNA ligase